MSRIMNLCGYHTALMSVMSLSVLLLQGHVAEADAFTVKDNTSVSLVVTDSENTLTIQDYSPNDVHKHYTRNYTQSNEGSGLFDRLNSVFKRQVEVKDVDTGRPTRPTTVMSPETSEMADIGMFPFVVAVYRKDLGEPRVCAGTIYSATLVLTSGLCVGKTQVEQDPNKYSILAGVNDLSMSTDQKAQWRVVTKMSFDKEENPKVVFMTVGSPFEFNWRVGPKRIPFEKFAGWRKCTVIGWAQTDTPSRNERGRLLYMTMFVVGSSTCGALYPTANHKELHTSVCAEQYDVKKHDKGTCMGDDGTVLFCNDVIRGFVRSPTGWACDDNYDVPSTWLDVGALGHWTADVLRTTGVKPQHLYRSAGVDIVIADSKEGAKGAKNGSPQLRGVGLPIMAALLMLGLYNDRNHVFSCCQ